MNNEQVGISAEIAIADFFGVHISEQYRARGSSDVVNAIYPVVCDIFRQNNIPKPLLHVAEGQSPVDFKLESNKTMSVKTNKGKLGKAAPQKVGQASSSTWFNHLAGRLNIQQIPSTYEGKTRCFKQIALARIDDLLTIYWDNMFECDFLVCIYNIVDRDNVIIGRPSYIVFKKSKSPIWDKNHISFTRDTLSAWNESTTVKYDSLAIGEFQVHNNRDNFKFRFNLASIAKLIDDGRLRFS